MPKKVLIVDDTPGALAPLREVLTQASLTVIEATSGRQAMEVHRRERADLIIMDMQMPGLDGTEVTRAIRADAALRDVSILLFVDTWRAGLRERCLAVGANDFLAKPFEDGELMARVWPLINVAPRKGTALIAHIETERDVSPSIDPFVARIVNVSISGVLFEADVPLTIGRMVHVRFFVPGSPVQISATATVTRRTEGSGTTRWGVHFLVLDPAVQQALRDYAGE